MAGNSFCWECGAKKIPDHCYSILNNTFHAIYIRH
jgi:hypothetical protein